MTAPGHIPQQELDDLKTRNPCSAVAGKWVALRRKANGYIGPCPLHSPDPQARDSTSFECWDDRWVCASCDEGGDVIRLVMLREQIDFRTAIEWLGGTREVSAEAAERLAAEHSQRQAASQSERNEWRERERARSWDMWQYGRPIAGTDVERYLALRGLDVPPGVRLRFDAAARLYVEDRPRHRLVHTGPAMLAQIQRGGRHAGLHTTFLDLGRPKGKAIVVDGKSGATLPSKKMRGSKRGGHIHLVGPREPREIVLGEGIEKVLAIWTAMSRGGRDLSCTAFWSSADLGNLGGKAKATVRHPTLKTDTGRARRVPGPEPELEEPAIEIPDSVARLVLLGDSTSDRFSTEQVMLRAQARYARSGREVVVAWAPEGKDFDDVIREARA